MTIITLMKPTIMWYLDLQLRLSRVRWFLESVLSRFIKDGSLVDPSVPGKVRIVF